MIEGFIDEETLGKRLALDRSKLKKLRPKKTETDDAGNILWSEVDAHALAKTMGLTLIIEAEKAAPGAIGREPEDVLVTSYPVHHLGGHHFPNKNLIKARRAAATGREPEIVLRVVDSSKYVLGMKVRAIQSEDGNWWRLVGREPRFKGKF